MIHGKNLIPMEFNLCYSKDLIRGRFPPVQSSMEVDPGGMPVRKTLNPILLLVAAAVLASACDRGESDATAPPPIPEGAVTQPADGTVTGRVLETMNSGGYTYVRVDSGRGEIWAATPEFSVQAGDEVAVPRGMPMRDFQSNTLNRTFDLIYFVGSIDVKGRASSGMDPARMPQGHPPVGTGDLESGIEVSGIEKAEGGMTVAEIYDGQASLEGREVLVRGRVVKFNANIMGRNWLHLRDGTGGDETNDLTVTTDAAAMLGDVVLVKGTLAVGKDFGFGYQYDILLENATVEVEQRNENR
jgi:hypothetical protein